MKTIKNILVNQTTPSVVDQPDRLITSCVYI